MPSNIGSSPVPEPAVAVGEDPRRYARLMSAVYDATMAGNRAPARPREVIGDSWRRMLARGVDPGVGTDPVVDTGALEMLRRSSGLIDVLDEISHGLESLVAEGANILVVADARGRVLWRSGSPQVLVNADRLRRRDTPRLRVVEDAEERRLDAAEAAGGQGGEVAARERQVGAVPARVDRGYGRVGDERL